tara:strand:+ start:2212 stop:2445 length:234 start_codon:yes stop_codon:yes gene_type:complete
MMSDHQDSEHFMGVRSEDELLKMLDRAERKQNFHYVKMMKNNKKDRIFHMRNYKALEGVVKTLRWCLGDKDIEHPLE